MLIIVALMFVDVVFSSLCVCCCLMRVVCLGVCVNDCCLLFSWLVLVVCRWLLLFVAWCLLFVGCCLFVVVCCCLMLFVVVCCCLFLLNYDIVFLWFVV